MGQSADAVTRFGQSDPNNPDITPETVHLRRDIESTRTDMSGTLDAIQQRLNPETLGEQAKDTATDITAQAKEAALEVLDHALAGAKEQALEVIQEVQTQAREVLEQAREVLGEAKVTARDVIGEARVTAREAVEDATTQAKAAVRGATIGKVETMVRNANDTTNAARQGLVDTIKANPFPAALTGIGLGWLLINSRSAAARGSAAPRGIEAQYREQRAMPTGTASAYGGGQAYYPASGGNAPTGGNPLASGVDRAQSAVGNVASQAGDLVGRAGEKVGGAVGQLGETTGNVVGQIGETTGNIVSGTMEATGNFVGQIGETAGNLASGTVETAGNLAQQAQYQALRLEDGFQRVLRENPLAVGAVALALGAAVGLALPQTQRENQLMGEARDTLIERAQDLAQETIGKVQNVATEAQQTVKEEAKSQGLTQ